MCTRLPRILHFRLCLPFFHQISQHPRVCFILLVGILTLSLELYRIWWEVHDDTDEEKNIYDKHVLKLLAHSFQFKQSLMEFENKSFDHWNNHLHLNKMPLLILILTQQRKRLKANEQYLPLTVWSSVEASHKFSGNIFHDSIVVCNVEVQRPQEHYQTFQEFLPFVRVINITNSTPDISAIYKETQDYLKCLKASLEYMNSSSLKWILVLEDDVIVKPNSIYDLVHWHLPRIVHNRSQAENRLSHELAYVKLYHPPHLLGYLQPEYERWVDLLGVTAVFFGIFTSVHRILCQHVMPISVRGCLLPPRETVKRRSHISETLGTFTLAFMTAILLGRHALLEVRTLHPALYQIKPGAPFCCTQGILFTSTSVRDFIGYVEERLPSDLTFTSSNSHKLAIDEFLFEFGKFYKNKRGNALSWHIQPNLLEHVGRESNLRESSVITRHL